MVLTPRFEPMLAQAAESVPGPGVLAGGLALEQKFDGRRAILFTPAGPGGRVLLQTRRGSLIQDRFPDLVAAAEQLPDGLVLDGELVVWDTAAGRLSFEALQGRAAARGRTAAALAAKTPAFFVAFDVLQLDGQEFLTRPYEERRALLAYSSDRVVAGLRAAKSRKPSSGSAFTAIPGAPGSSDPTNDRSRPTPER
nr:hypothetical protein OG296_43540 [Streptomyces sp. NBC_01001]